MENLSLIHLGNYKDGALWGLDKESTRDATAAFYVPNGDVRYPFILPKRL